jgi:hypothetical protein
MCLKDKIICRNRDPVVFNESRILAIDFFSKLMCWSVLVVGGLGFGTGPLSHLL